jgi:structure-specific endonuclease subunit SLX1
MEWKCYCLATVQGSPKTYIGITPDLDRRLSQHNGLQAGGAMATKGRIWERICHVKGFPDHRAALQFEWRWKQLSRKLPQKMHPLERRIMALKELLSLERPTSKAISYSEWPTPPEVHLEYEEAADFYNSSKVF